MQFYFALALTAAALVAWVLLLRLPANTSRTNALGLTLAPLAAAWLVALLPPASDNLFYKAAVVLGMLLALLALAFRQSQLLPSYAAHAHLFITYVLYGLAFASQTQGWPTPWAILLIAAAGLLYYWLYPTLFEQWPAVAVYALLILFATWQALELALQQPNSWMGWAALAGMILATIATLLEAQAHFRPIRPSLAVASIPVFLMAQLLIAWSVWG